MKRPHKPANASSTSLKRQKAMSTIFRAAVLVLLLCQNSAFAQQSSGPSQEQGGNVFQQSNLYYAQMGAVLMMREGHPKQAAQQFRRLIGQFPQIPNNHYFLAVALARQNKFNDAFDRLMIAARRGFANVKLMKADPAFGSVRGQKRFLDLIDAVKANIGKIETVNEHKISPNVVNKGIALVNESNTIWDPKSRILKSAFQFNRNGKGQTLVQAGEDALQQLNEWYLKGQAAGNIGDLYDNHDRNHSGGRSAQFFPQMTIVKYGASALKAGVDYGLNFKMLFNAITIGNSSTVAEGRSQARYGLTLPGIPEILFLQYVNNHMYVYPEHRDYDPDRGDLLPANTPYMIISKGSSRSDQPFLRAVASILAAFRPDVKDYLRKTHLVMPTVQMIFRRGQKSIETDADYLGARAHPPVFRSENIDLAKMITLANLLTIEDIPPMVLLKVVEESGPKPGIDDFASGMSETLFNTPSAVARVVRSTAYEKRIVIRAGNTGAKADAKLKYHWIILSGDTDRIKINPRNIDSSEVELLVPWHERRPVPGLPGMTTDRVEIGVFVDNGKNYSAPAFVNFLYPNNQKREYNEQGQILSIDHQYPDFGKRYQESRLFVKRSWKDIYQYDKNSKLTGWQRKRGKWLDNYSRDGAKIVEWDEKDRPTKARIVGYSVMPSKAGISEIVEHASKKFLFYHYDGDQDRIGRVSRE